MAKKAAKKASEKTRDVDYTIAGLIAIVAIVLFTAMFFRGSLPSGNQSGDASGNLAGQAGSGGVVDTDAPKECEASSYCDGTRLIRRHTDCQEYTAFCQYGCEQLETGGAQCR